MFELELAWWEPVARAAIVYLSLLALLRLTGKRQIGDLTPFDILLLLISEAVSSAPMGRAGQSNEVASCYVFLASADASYMTGQVLHPNGGTVGGS